MKMKLFVSFLLLVGLVIPFTVIQPAEAEDPRSKMGLVALWTFDKDTIQANKVEDVFGENNGTITGKPDQIDGFRGEALDFDGVTDLIRMDQDIFFPSVTMEAIIKPTLGTRNPIYDKYNYGIQLLDNNNVGLWIRADTANQAKHWPSAYVPYPTDGEWHHVVGVVENKKSVRIYLDGELIKSTPAPDPISIAYGASQKPTIAYTQHLGGIWYAGAIDEVAIFEGALSDADVKRLYTLALAVEHTGKLTVTWGKLKTQN
ncbi:MAG: LamG domain-containing protein [Candidatus Poribacteria bacterium]|nr:LamG domain-containing protein [Candidatus Poribacteria bacterium]